MIHIGNCLDILPTLPAESVQTCITSPPYFGLRDYGVAGQLGLEATPREFVDAMVRVFAEVRRVLRDDGTLWLNLGDSYAGGGCGSRDPVKWPKQSRNDHRVVHAKGNTGLRRKNLIGIPWRVAFALQADGWYLRQDIIWHKPNPMPESVRDRCTKAHEYLFLLSKSPGYYFDAEAIAEPPAQASIDRLGQSSLAEQAGRDRVPGKTNGPMKAKPPRFGGSKYGDNSENPDHRSSGNDWEGSSSGRAKKRSVWTVPTAKFSEAHFATFPERLIEPCVLAGSRHGDLVLDPFMGAGTTAVVAERLARRWVGCELNPEYARIAEARIRAIQPGLALGAA